MMALGGKVDLLCGRAGGITRNSGLDAACSVARTVGAIALAACAMVVAAPTLAQAWPDRPVKVIVPFPAGGSNDVVARIFAKVLGEKLGQPFVIENRAGANGNLGAAAVAAAPPDGYTLLFTSTGPLVYNKVIYKSSMTFDPAKDFTPIVEVAKIPLIIASNLTLPAKSFQEMVAYAKANPGKVTFASPGNGSMGHLTADLVQTNLGFRLTHVPYRGSAPAMNDLLGGVVNINVDFASNYAPHVQAGTLRALAITAPKRWSLLPDAPTLSELGMPDFDATGWIAIVGPAGIPVEAVGKINKAANDFIATREGIEALEKQGMVPVGGSAENLRSFMASELEKWRPAAEKITPE
ncbi:tripartite tricarboxylate transporter substrate binding protein [Bradyrhizobium sp. LHD-71]|uniref:Bug family tripartite tricarboxylate transporter substrate binding protein n=1 Tax=Bradyrhizobium sp. LHD-71 TaxID=3072141 RepID=UPI00280E1F07|nr:tripartite tricarboxylate transporter substrate binding protein [Bradyrhizobium sp. LHD-71]MDQ8729348.1 tripartite tricarboxylate transporter substrate binding protein [Bradyrhizobium sp. LHD-71]